MMSIVDKWSDWVFSDVSDEEKDDELCITSVPSKASLDRETPDNGHTHNHIAPPTSDVTLLDDGWMSDENDSFTECEVRINNEALVWRVQEVWLRNKKEITSELRSLIHSLFNEHDDVYSLVLTFIVRVGKTRPPPKCLPRIILTEFIDWRSTLAEPLPSCSPAHQTKVIELLERCHHVLFDLLADIFDLCNASKRELIDLIRHLLDCYNYTDALSYAIKLRLQEEFSTTEVLTPLIAMDKINIIENYLLPYPKLQAEFLNYIEELYSSTDTLTRVKCDLRKNGIQFTSVDKLTHQHLEKLAIRLINLFHLSHSNYPQLFERQSISSLNYLLHKKYIEGTLADDELLGAAVRGRPVLQFHLITELVDYNDFPLASHYTALFDIPQDNIPTALREYIQTHSPSPPFSPRKSLHDRCHNDEDVQLVRNMQQRINNILSGGLATQQKAMPIRRKYHTLKLPSRKIIFVNDQRTFNICMTQLQKAGNVIGIDAEWRLPICNNGKERLSLLQLAISSMIFLVDTINLPKLLPHLLLKTFVEAIFDSKEIIKLGYEVQGDIRMLAKSWPFAASCLLSPKRVIDLKYMSETILQSKDPVLPPSPPPSPAPPITISVEVVPGLRKQFISSYGRGLNRLPPPSSLSSPNGIPYSSSYSTTSSSSYSTTSSSSYSTTSSSSCSTTSNTSGYSSGSETQKATGLSLLVMKCLGRPLDKTYQLSDWDRRPLLHQQVKYAALDAYCLLEVYDHLKSLSCNNMMVEPTLEYVQEKLKFERQERRMKKKATS